MAIPYIILVLGYAFIISLFLLIVISLKGKWIFKFCMIPVLLWFGLFLYYIPPQLTGYPSEQNVIDDNVIVRYFTYQAPTQTEEGHLYIVVDTRFFKDLKEKTFIDKINPLNYTDISGSEYLRLYRIPWDEELVRGMNQAQKRKQLIVLKKKKNKSESKGKEGREGNKKKSKGKKGRGKLIDKSGSGDNEGKGGSGGTAKNSGNEESKYTIDALTPNEIFKKTN